LQEQVAALDNLPVEVSGMDGHEIPGPLVEWSEGVERKYFSAQLKDILLREGLLKPTLIQRYAVPIICCPRRPDVLASAQTGSGKTFAFVIPIVSRIMETHGSVMRPWFPGTMAQASPLTLMMSPTRELAIQTHKEVQCLIRGTAVTSMVMYGGENLSTQVKIIQEKQIDILCGTPGRVLDAVDAGKLSLSFIQTLVLDEADMMLDQGLEGRVDEIITQRDVPPKTERQTFLFSATFPPRIKQMCDKVLRSGEDYAYLRVGHYKNETGGTCENIAQFVKYATDDANKFVMVFDDIMRHWDQTGKIIIFSNRIKQAVHLSNILRARGMAVGHLHGKQDQPTREDVVENFKKGVYKCLVATNVAARGLDFPDIKLVVQFDLPETIDTYTHRVGRTGRVGQEGVGLSYFTWADRRIAQQLLSFLEVNKQEVPEFLRSQAKNANTGRGRYDNRGPQFDQRDGFGGKGGYRGGGGGGHRGGGGGGYRR